MSTTSSTNPVSSSSSKTAKSKTIEKIVFGGAGLTRDDGCVIFVPFSAPGDEVSLKITEEKKNYKTATIETVHKEGKSRTPPRCPHFQTCGGCQLQHLTYEAELEAKQSFVEEALGIDVEIVPSPSPWLYRSHARFNLRKKGDGYKFGFVGIDNSSLIEVEGCPLFLEDPPFFSALKAYLSTLPNKGVQSGSLRIFKTKNAPVLAFSFFPKLPKKLPPFPAAEGLSFKSPGTEKHFGNTTLHKEILGESFEFSPYGFMQSNLPISEKLYEAALDAIGPKPKRILDLYCGIGITTTLLSKMGHEVIGVESNRKALKHAKEGHFICAPVEQALPKLLKTFKPDAILVNPPKTGLSKEILPLLTAPQLLYISCMPPTLKRDLKALEARYQIEQALAFDMFPQTTHVETLLTMNQQK